MERCPHCGAATRPGAKFCTSCGTRLDDQAATQPAESVWSEASPTEETQVSTPAVTSDDADADADADTGSVTPEPNWAAVTVDGDAIDTGASDPSIESMWAKRPTENEADTKAAEREVAEGSSWFSKWPESSSESSESDSPADRFREALDAGAAPVASEETSTAEEPTFPERNVWSWGAPSDEVESSEEEPVTIASSAADADADEIPTESATISSLQDTTVVSEDAQASGATQGAVLTEGVAGDDARTRATALIDELRGLVWKIGEEDSSLPDQSPNQTIISNMKRVRGETSDFSDLRSVIGAVRDNPRDIDALRDLGQQADRLQALLDSHAALTRALEDAIRQGQ